MSDNSGSRRNFIKNAAIGGLAISIPVGVGSKVFSVPKADVQKAYMKDVVPGDKVWQKREYVPMTKIEKKQMVQMFTDNHKKESS